MAEYLTSLAQILDDFFKCLSDCGLMTSYTVQLQSNIHGLESILKFRNVIQELVKNLQSLLSSIPTVELAEASTQTLDDVTEVVLTCHPISLEVTDAHVVSPVPASQKHFSQELVEKQVENFRTNNGEQEKLDTLAKTRHVSSIQICEIKPIILESSDNIPELEEFRNSEGKSCDVQTENIVHIVVETANTGSKAFFHDTSQGDSRNLEPWTCCKCDLKFDSESQLKDHQQTQHSAQSSVQHCDMCDKVFNCVQSLQEHCRQEHEGVGCFSCFVCGRRFMTKLSCNRHMDTHKGNRNATCGICGKVFSRADYLQTHYSIHAGKRGYACSQCPSKFVRRIHLKAHEKTHTGVKDHICKVCNKGFSRSDKLREHTLRHLNIKRFQCPICKREYAEKRDLKVHLNTHTKVK